QTRHHDLAAAHFRGAVHRDQIPVEDPGIFHAHAGDLQQVMRPRLKQSGIDLQPRLEVLFGEDGLAGGHPADERQPDLLPDGVLERSEEHTSELQSQSNLVCRLLLEKKKKDSNGYVQYLNVQNALPLALVVRSRTAVLNARATDLTFALYVVPTVNS